MIVIRKSGYWPSTAYFYMYHYLHNLCNYTSNNCYLLRLWEKKSRLCTPHMWPKHRVLYEYSSGYKISLVKRYHTRWSTLKHYLFFYVRLKNHYIKKENYLILPQKNYSLPKICDPIVKRQTEISSLCYHL